jgi:hypothetical protein
VTENHTLSALASELGALIAELSPLIRPLAVGRYAISIGGSRGKGNADGRSDVDFRLFCDEQLPPGPERDAAREAHKAAIARWRERGIEIDGCWVRLIGKISAELDDWLQGKGRPTELTWAIWGYYLPTDIYNMQVMEDPYGVIAEWQERLRVYPAALRQAVLDKHLGSLRYWRKDYHYANKVPRGDVVFLAGLTARLVHDMIQVIFALNETYYPGDGANLQFIAKMKQRPERFAERVAEILYPSPGGDVLARQREALLALIAEVEELAERGQERV